MMVSRATKTDFYNFLLGINGIINVYFMKK